MIIAVRLPPIWIGNVLAGHLGSKEGSDPSVLSLLDGEARQVVDSVADAADRRDHRDVVAEFGAQPPDVHVDGPGLRAVGGTPHVGEQGLSAEHLAVAAAQMEQQVELHPGELEADTAQPHGS
jgi:hypothetical protein